MIASVRSRAASKSRWASAVAAGVRVAAGMGDLPMRADRPPPGTVREVDRPRGDEETGGAGGGDRPAGRPAGRREARQPRGSREARGSVPPATRGYASPIDL